MGDDDFFDGVLIRDHLVLVLELLWDHFSQFLQDPLLVLVILRELCVIRARLAACVLVQLAHVLVDRAVVVERMVVALSL